MTIVFNEEKALRAINVFEALMADRSLIKNSRKGLIIATAMAYHGKFTINTIKENFGDVIDTLYQFKNAGIIELVTPSSTGRKECYVYRFKEDKFPQKHKSISKDIAYLFTNCLFNTLTYISKYGITSWSVIGLALESTLKTGYSNSNVTLHLTDIQSVSGDATSKRNIRRQCVGLGFMKEVGKGSNCYKLNRRAYLLGSAER